jgi:hypothetical protein
MKCLVEKSRELGAPLVTSAEEAWWTSSPPLAVAIEGVEGLISLGEPTLSATPASEEETAALRSIAPSAFTSSDGAYRTTPNVAALLSGFARASVSFRAKSADGEEPSSLIFELGRWMREQGRLPSAFTCTFKLYLPNYSTVELCRQKLLYVMENCGTIDADFEAADADAFLDAT